MKFRKFFSKSLKTNPKLKNLRGIKKTDEAIKAVKSDSVLAKALKSMTWKGVFVGAGAVTSAALIGAGAKEINDFLTDNSGCFLVTKDDVCKITQLSCCNPSLQNVPACKNLNVIRKDACLKFVSTEECCNSCDCETIGGCGPGQTVECRWASVGDALTHFVKDTFVGSAFDSVIRILKFVAIAFVIAIAFMFVARARRT